MFSKRHYEAIAMVMQNTKPSPGFGTCDAERNRELDQWTKMVRALRDRFKRDNPAFLGERFERACIPGANVRARG